MTNRKEYQTFFMGNQQIVCPPYISAIGLNC